MIAKELNDKKEKLSDDINHLIKQFIEETGLIEIEVNTKVSVYDDGCVRIIESIKTDVSIKL